MTSASRSKGDDVAAVAASLTEAQRLYLWSVPLHGPAAARQIRADVYGPDWHLGQPYWDDESNLIKHDLIRQLVNTARHTTLTMLGLAVRAHLTDQEGQNR